MMSTARTKLLLVAGVVMMIAPGCTGDVSGVVDSIVGGVVGGSAIQAMIGLVLGLIAIILGAG